MNMQGLPGVGVLLVNVFTIVIPGLFLWFLWNCFKTVKQGEAYPVLWFGKYTRTLYPGLNFKIPWIETLGKVVDTREKMKQVKSQSVITRDNAVVEIEGSVFFMITHPHLAAYNVADLDTAIQTLKQANLRAIIGAMELDDVLSQRDEINQHLMNAVAEATRNWGIKITRVEITEVKPSPNMVTAMELQMEAERRKRVAFLNAEAQEREAEALAKATTTVSEALREGDSTAINYFASQKYLETMTAFATSPNEKILILPTEVTGVIGSIAGIAEIAKKTFLPKPNGVDHASSR